MIKRKLSDISNAVCLDPTAGSMDNFKYVDDIITNHDIKNEKKVDKTKYRDKLSR